MNAEMMTMEERAYEAKYEELVKSKVLELFKDTAATVFLFGSRARGDYKRGSDYDIGIESLDYETFRRLKIKFDAFWDESIVPYKVDFVHFDTTKPRFKTEAKKDVVIWKVG